LFQTLFTVVRHHEIGEIRKEKIERFFISCFVLVCWTF